MSNNTVDYYSLNAMLNLYGENGEIQFDKDKEAARQYHLQHVNENTVFFHDLQEKIAYLVDEGYYDEKLINKYDFEDIKNIYKHAYSYKFRFPTFIGAYKFYSSYALKKNSGDKYLERYEDRVSIVALYLADGDVELAYKYVDEIITGRVQPATPTFLNAGRKNSGEPVSCYLIDVQDNMESIGRSINSALQLSKRGGGVGININNIRATGDPIKKVENQSSGVIPVMKLYENAFTYANQLGARQGAGAIYISVHHPDVTKVLDSKRENADEKIRIKTLSVGLIVSDKMFELAQKDKDLYQFSPYDVEQEYGKAFSEISVSELYDELVENPNIRKTKIPARDLFMLIAESQFESGYPYIMFEDQVNRMNNTPNVGRIQFSNLCSEILQPTVKSTMNPDGSYKEVGMDISCNLASMNIAKMMENSDGISESVEMAIRALTKVSENSQIDTVPPVEKGNKLSHAVGLGQMNLHGFLGSEKIHYGSFEALDFVNIYFSTIMFHAVKASNKLAIERNETFHGFEGSKFETGEFFTPFVNARFDKQDEDLGGHDLFVKTDRIQRMVEQYGFTVPQRSDWVELAASVKEHGLYNRNLLAVAPTGSISFINNSTMSIHPNHKYIMSRKEGAIGRVYMASPGLTEDNVEYFTSAFDLGATPVIETYNAAAPYVDQGLSLTLFFRDTATTRDLNVACVKAWAGTETFHGNDHEGAGTPWNKERRQKLGAVSKTIYYVRIYQEALEGTDVETCVSCML